MISFTAASSPVTAFKSAGTLTHIYLADGQLFAIAADIRKLSENVAIDLSQPVTPETKLEILLRPFEMTQEEWNSIRAVLAESREFTAAIANHPDFKSWMEMDINQLKQLPLQAYGGSYASTLYLRWPLCFWLQKSGKYYNLFVDGDYLVKAYVDLAAHSVEVISGRIPGHIL